MERPSYCVNISDDLRFSVTCLVLEVLYGTSKLLCEY